MLTELRIDGGNCPTCFNDTLDLLRATPGVRRVDGSITGECVAIEHDDVGVDALVAVVRARLHGVSMASAEVVMVAVDPEVAALGCPHGRH